MIEQKVSRDLKRRDGQVYLYQRHHKGRAFLGELRHYRDLHSKAPIRIYFATKCISEANAETWKFSINALRFMKAMQPHYFGVEFKRKTTRLIFVTTWVDVEARVAAAQTAGHKLSILMSRSDFKSNDDRSTSHLMTVQQLMIGRGK